MKDQDQRGIRSFVGHAFRARYPLALSTGVSEFEFRIPEPVRPRRKDVRGRGHKCNNLQLSAFYKKEEQAILVKVMANNPLLIRNYPTSNCTVRFKMRSVLVLYVLSALFSQVRCLVLSKLIRRKSTYATIRLWALSLHTMDIHS